MVRERTGLPQFRQGCPARPYTQRPREREPAPEASGRAPEASGTVTRSPPLTLARSRSRPVASTRSIVLDPTLAETTNGVEQKPPSPAGMVYARRLRRRAAGVKTMSADWTRAPERHPSTARTAVSAARAGTPHPPRCAR